MHFKDKEREKLYKNILKTLKPGGKLMISDYCRGEKPSPQVFLDYEKQRGYNLHTVKNYGKTLEKTGFSKVVALDKTNLMVNIMKMELKKFYEIKDSYIKKFSQKDFDDIEGVCKPQILFPKNLNVIFFRDGKKNWFGVQEESWHGVYLLQQNRLKNNHLLKDLKDIDMFKCYFSNFYLFVLIYTYVLISHLVSNGTFWC